MSHEVERSPHGVLNFLERNLDATGFNPGPRCGQWFMSKALFMHNQSFTPLR